MSLGLPSITIAFKSTSATAIERSQRGIIAMILRETSLTTAGQTTNTITTNFVANDTLTFDGITFKATAAVQDATDFEVGATIAATATNIATALNANSTVNATYTAAAANGVITITEKTAGGGNTPGSITVSGTGAITTSSTTTSCSLNTSASPYTIYSSTDIPSGLCAANQEQIELALEGYQTSPNAILVYVQASTEVNYNDVLLQLEHDYWDYLVIPGIATADVTTIATWIKNMRNTYDKKVKAILPNCSGDNEGIINFTNTSIVTTAGTFTTAQYCSRIAGIIAGTPLTISCTFAPLSEVTSCDKYTTAQMSTKVGNGELFIMYDGTKYKIARGVNSFVTWIQSKNQDFSKIKMVDIMDMIHDDIKNTANDYYIGKYANDYDNKCLLISAINGYFDTLVTEGLLDPDGTNLCSIDTTAQKNYLLSNGDYTAAELAKMTNLEINKCNTRDQVFLTADVKILDAIENITLNVYI